MWENNHKKIVFVDGCLSAAYNDLAEAFGMYSLESWGSKDQIYIGWRQTILVTTGLLEPLINTTTKGIKMFWERMGQGDSISETLRYIDYNAPANVKMALFGPNGTRDLLDIEGDDNIFMYCLPGVSINSIYLGW